MSTDFCIIGAHPQYVDVAIRKILSVEDELLKRYALLELWCECVCWSCRLSKTVSWDSPSSRAISLELLHGSRLTAAVTACSLAGVCVVHGRSAFTVP